MTNILLTERDYHILFELWQNRAMTIRQLMARFWPGKARATCVIRMGELLKAGLVRLDSVPFLRVQSLYRPALEGNRVLVAAKWLKPEFEKDYGSRIKEASAALMHDLDVVDLRIALQASAKLEGWISDHELRLARSQDGFSNRTPDGYFSWVGPEGRVDGVLENERARYRESNFVQILRRLRAHYPKAYIFFVVREPRRIETIARWVRSSQAYNDRPNAFLTAPLEAVKASGFNAKWQNHLGGLPEDDKALKSLLEASH